MEDYGMHKEEYARSLKELTAIVMGNPNAALCQSLLSFSLLNEALSKHGPVRLYRYQPFDERNVRDFLSGAIHMSSPDSFNDVNEGWQRFDESAVRDEVNKASDFDISALLVKEWDRLAGAMGKVRPNGQIPTVDQVAALWDASIRDGGDLSGLADCMLAASWIGLETIRESARCASLSETVLSASMWDRYADGHKGFALSYDFNVFNPSCCIGRDHAEELDAAGLLVPVLYGRRVDLSGLFMACCLFPGLPDSVNNLYFLTLANVFSRKALEWNCEREWRVLTLAPPRLTDQMYVAKKPRAVFLGLEMGADERRRLVEAAEEAGLDIYSMEMDYESEDYSLKPMPGAVPAN